MVLLEERNGEMTFIVVCINKVLSYRMWISSVTILKLIAIIHFVYVCGQTTDPCTRYKSVELSKYRGDNCPTKTSKKDICDKYITPGWFRSDDGSEILTKPPSIHTCATTFPIWMNGTFPQAAEGEVKRQACMVNQNSVCAQSFNISVKNCSTFFVYFLQRPSVCPAAYCFGTNKGCPPLEPCDYYYHELLESDDRNSVCKSTSGTQNCDNSLKPDWYRLLSKFSQVKKLSNTCPDMYNCGTESPVWVQGTNPTIVDGIINLTACVHGTSSCCEKSYPIKIKNCTNFLVYYLEPVKSCPERYCYENHGTCAKTTNQVFGQSTIKTLTTALTAHNKNAQVSTGCIGKCITEVAIGVSVAVIFTVAIVAAIIMLVLKRFKRAAIVGHETIKSVKV